MFIIIVWHVIAPLACCHWDALTFGFASLASVGFVPPSSMKNGCSKDLGEWSTVFGEKKQTRLTHPTRTNVYTLVLQIAFQEVQYLDPKHLPKIHSQKGLGALGIYSFA